MKPNLKTPCATCCNCPAPTLQWDSVSASSSKCGFSEFSGYVSSPPRIYKSSTISGSYGYNSSFVPGSPNYITLSFEGTATVNPNTCVFDTSPWLEVDSDLGTRPWTLPTTNGTVLSGRFGNGCFSTTLSSTVGETSIFDTGEEGCDRATPGTTYQTLSDEYTTAQLTSNTTAALPNFPGTWDGTAGSYCNLTTDEVTLSIRSAKYRFQFQPPKVGAGKCYIIGPWVERFTPAAGSDPVDTVKDAWQWDGTLPSGYDPSDSSTWPTSPEYTVPIPDANGTTLVGYYTDPDDPTTFVSGTPPAVCTGCTS